MATLILRDVRHQALGAFQQYLRNQNMFCIYDIGYDKLAAILSKPQLCAKSLTLENCVLPFSGAG